jgi:hypothetical protein
MKKVVLITEIDDEVLVCPYCMSEVRSGSRGCCGESSDHFETAFEVNGELFLKNEIEVVDNN